MDNKFVYPSFLTHSFYKLEKLLPGVFIIYPEPTFDSDWDIDSLNCFLTNVCNQIWIQHKLCSETAFHSFLAWASTI